ncbi:uncharacterized protein DC041_0012388 [Schistosoma bovis]|uniref:EF-hand domain-containing protein n=1 Tax=Schistosoma bovis TaxID=6184 RepID=A0A430Q789_SCHBO|nr:uncharacterized protein DC041_0012388 [Schistosoma bovis]
MKHVEQWRRTFNEVDQDRSGQLSLDEIRNVLRELGYRRVSEDALNRWMQSVDKNCNQMIDFSEFSAFLYENWQE